LVLPALAAFAVEVVLDNIPAPVLEAAAGPALDAVAAEPAALAELAAVAPALPAAEMEVWLPALRILCRISRLRQTEHRIVHKTLSLCFLP